MFKHGIFLVFFFSTFECIAQYEQIVDSLYVKLENSTEEEKKAQLYLEIIYALTNNDWDRQMKVFEEAKPLFEKYPKFYTPCLYQTAWGGTKFGKFDYADSVYTHLLDVFREDTLYQKGIFTDMALARYDNYQLKEAKEIVQNSFINDIQNRENSIYTYRYWQAYDVSGQISEKQGLYTDALSDYEQCQYFAQTFIEVYNLHEPNLIGSNYFNITSTEFKRGNINGCLDNLQHAYRWLEDPLATKIDQIESYLLLLDIYVELGLKGLEVEALFRKTKILVDETETHYFSNKLELIRLKRAIKNNETEAAGQRVQKLLVEMNESESKFLLPEFLLNRINLNFQTGDTIRAKAVLEDLKKLSAEEDLVQYAGICKIMEADFLINEGKTDQALNSVKQVLIGAEGNGDLMLELSSLEQIVKCLVAMEDFEKLPALYEKIAKKKEQISINETGLNNLSELFNSVHKLLKLDTNEVVITSGEKEYSKGKWFKYISILSLVFLTTVFLLRKRQNPSQRPELEPKSSVVEKEPSQDSDKLREDLLNGNLDWAGFILQYEKAFPDFMEQCRHLNIPLTANTMRNILCMRMNLTVKETAQVNGVSYEAVKKARYRIKKKMELEKEESLIEFIRKM